MRHNSNIAFKAGFLVLVWNQHRSLDTSFLLKCFLWIPTCSDHQEHIKHIYTLKPRSLLVFDPKEKAADAGDSGDLRKCEEGLQGDLGSAGCFGEHWVSPVFLRIGFCQKIEQWLTIHLESLPRNWGGGGKRVVQVLTSKDTATNPWSAL